MANTLSYFSDKRRSAWCLDKCCNWSKLLFALFILFLNCRNGDTAILQLNVPGSMNDAQLNLRCNFIQDNSNAKNNLEFCKNATFDAIVTYSGETFVFKGEKYWKQVNNGIAPGYPKLISQKWQGLPGNLSTAFIDANGKYIYFFKGSQYWKFDGDRMEEGFPRYIKKDFLGVPDDLQAAVLWIKNGVLYLFKGDSYWDVNMSQQPFEVSDEKPMKEWAGIPGYLDAALQSPGYITYFFKQGKYYKYNDKTESIELNDPPYPKRVASNWFGCPKVIRLIEE